MTGLRYSFQNAEFIKTAVKPVHYPETDDLPEVAVAGRSNVGKSSLLNHLFRRRKLVKTSSTPGKTQALNFFLVDDALVFCDLPGYGYAKVALSVKERWGPMAQTYLDERKDLKLVLFLIDIRRVPNQDDLQLLEWCLHAEKAMILVLTKVDKVKRGDRERLARKIIGSLGLAEVHHVFYSTTKNEGRDELIALINEAVTDELAEEG